MIFVVIWNRNLIGTHITNFKIISLVSAKSRAVLVPNTAAAVNGFALSTHSTLQALVQGAVKLIIIIIIIINNASEVA